MCKLQAISWQSPTKKVGIRTEPPSVGKGMDGGVQRTKASRIKILVRIKDSLSLLSAGRVDRYTTSEVRRKQCEDRQQNNVAVRARNLHIM